MIKFNCPHCKKLLKVKDELGGKKAKCPGCQKVITIPKPAEESAPAPPAPELEELAAAALADEPQAAPPPEEPTFIEFDCPFCDEKIRVSAELAGRNEPCPHCRRIVKVPEPIRTERKDWRKADKKLPSGARRDTEPAPEGVWGSAAGTSRVSAQALEEAKAIPRVRERVTVRQWIVRGLVVTGAVALIVVGVLGALRMRAKRTESGAIDQALAYLDAKGKSSRLPADAGAEISRGAGEFSLRAGQLADANKNFRKARADAIQVDAEAFAHDALLLALADNQIELGGPKEEVTQGTRMAWGDAEKEVLQTLQNLKTPAAQVEALRLLTPKYVAKNQSAEVKALASILVGGDPLKAADLLAIVGLEMLRAGQQQVAGELATQALTPYKGKPKAAGSAAGPALPVSPSLIALLYALGRESDAGLVAELPPPNKDVPGEIRVGHAMGFAYKGKWDEAMNQVKAIGGTEPRFQALVGVAAIALEKNNSSLAASALEEGGKLIESELKSRPQTRWQVWRWAKLAPQAGLTDDRLQAIISQITDEGLRTRAQQEVLEARLAANQQPDMDAMDRAAKTNPPNGLVLETLARHNAHFGNGGAVLKAVNSWTPDTLRPFGYIGVALGVQDSGK